MPISAASSVACAASASRGVRVGSAARRAAWSPRPTAGRATRSARRAAAPPGAARPARCTLADEPEARRRLGVVRQTGEEHVLGVRHADQAGQAIGRRRQSDVHAGADEPRLGRGEAHVAAQRELDAATDAPTVDRRRSPARGTTRAGRAAGRSRGGSRPARRRPRPPRAPPAGRRRCRTPCPGHRRRRPARNSPRRARASSSRSFARIAVPSVLRGGLSISSSATCSPSRLEMNRPAHARAPCSSGAAGEQASTSAAENPASIRTSRLCSPISAGPRRSAGGVRDMLEWGCRRSRGCPSRTTTPRACTCGSASAWSMVLIGPQGMPLRQQSLQPAPPWCRSRDAPRSPPSAPRGSSPARWRLRSAGRRAAPACPIASQKRRQRLWLLTPTTI